MTPSGIQARVNRLLAAAAMLGLLSGCTAGNPTPEEISVDTAPLGTLMPGTRHWLGWLKANEHCSAHGKSPQLHDLKGSVAIYRCVADQD